MLRIVGRMPNGYHQLQTVFQFVEHCDLLDFRVRDDGLIQRVSDVPEVPAEQDLMVRAAHLLAEQLDDCQGVDIRIDKRLPMGGGLGGGSSDAATTLLALNHLWDARLSTESLAELGLQLGADVPIFVHGHAAWAEGVGEKLRDVRPEEPWYLVVVPACHVSTAEIFQAPDLTRDSSRITIRAFVEGDRINDCLPVVRNRYPEVAQVFDWLVDFSKPQLTGTGACVFAAFDSRAAAEAVLSELPDGAEGFVARGSNRSPLQERLQQAVNSSPK